MNGQRRRLSYAVTILVLAAAAVATGRSEWKSSSEFHTLLEAITVLLAMFVGVIALLRYYAKRTDAALMVGAAFTGAALLDGVHAVLTASIGVSLAPSLPDALIPWSWLPSRLFLGAMLAARLNFAPRKPVGATLDPRKIHAIVLALVLLMLFFFSVFPLPSPYRPKSLFSRPQELVPCALFLIAAFRHYRWQAWRVSASEHLLLASLIIAAACHGMFMTFSKEVSDAMFDVAHALKAVSYATVLAGLLASVYQLFRESEREAEQRTFSFLENIPVGVFVCTAKGLPYYANDAATQLVGQPIDRDAAAEHFAKSFRPYVVGSNEEYPVDKMPLVRALAGERSSVSDMELRLNGETMPLQVHAAPIVGPDGVIAFAIAAFQDVRYLRRIALQDPLTSLVNRLGFEEAFRRLAPLCWRSKEALSIAMIDLDNFKLINDSYGHSAGDDVIKRVAEVALSCLRESDVVARRGGEEFAVLLPQTDLAGAVAALEKVLSAFRSVTFETADGRTFGATFSSGVATVTQDTPLEDGLAKADGYLYLAKKAGKNRVLSSLGLPREA